MIAGHWAAGPPTPWPLHPVVAACNLIYLPLQSGKSTYLRMVGVVTVLAHIGCFVPATFASIRLTDHILTRHAHIYAHSRTHACERPNCLVTVVGQPGCTTLPVQSCS